MSNQWEDLEKANFHLTESILFSSHLRPEHRPITLQSLFFLAFALFKRSELSNQPSHAIHVAKYLRYLRDQPHQAFGFPRHRVTKLLVDALAFQVESKAGDVVQNIGEMSALCCELLTSNVDITRPIYLIYEVVRKEIRPWVQDQPLDQLIECLRVVRKHKPFLLKALFALAFCLGIRYCMTFVNDDCEEAVSIFDEILASSAPVDDQNQFIARTQRLATGLAMLRSKTHHTPEYSEEAIYRVRPFLRSPLEEHDHHFFNSLVNHSWKDTAKRRFLYFGSIEGLEAPSKNLCPSQLVEAYDDFRSLDSSFVQIYDKLMLLEELFSCIRNNDTTDTEGVIADGRAILTSFDLNAPFAFYFLAVFGLILFEAFKRTNDIEYLDESISSLSRVLGYPFAQHLRLGTLRRLTLSLLIRSTRFPGDRMQDVDEAVKLLSRCVNDEHASLPARFEFACLWASFARGFRHSSTSTAYESAISTLQKVLPFAPTLQLQHTTLTRTFDYFHCMPLDYASFQIDLRQLEIAIETLERGRALLWSEMRYLRIPVDQLLEADPHLGHRFAAVSRGLEELTKSIPPSHELSMDDDGAEDLRAVDQFGRLLRKQRNLLRERDNLIPQIQALPGFDNFWTSPSFETLRSAASCGPIIIINHSKWRSDIVILLHNSPPSLIPTPANFYRRASGLKNRLLASRAKHGLDSSKYNRTLAFVLARLYKLVGKPVIATLRQLNVPEPSRIWWCPTSVFCSLPLHAMGPIPSDDGERRYFLDLYICSYTPTLSALIQSRHRMTDSRSSERPSLLLVAQTDPSLPKVEGEIQVVQNLRDSTNTEVTSLISRAATPTAVIDGFRHHQFVHFACHGTLESGKPFEAGFELYGNERLTLLEIVRAHLPTAEFAFLSACHTAEVTEGSIVDEVLHLAAAVQYCGFKSVVGTMWAMADQDGRDLAEHFYKALFSNNSRRLPYHERSAKALRFAVKKLRKKKGISLERWVNFVHYGA